MFGLNSVARKLPFALVVSAALVSLGVGLGGYLIGSQMVGDLTQRNLSSLAFESFVNIDDEGQRSEYDALARQDQVKVYFYDEALRHHLTKVIPNNLRTDVPLVLGTALRLRARIPNDRFDFDRAKADVIARTSL